MATPSSSEEIRSEFTYSTRHSTTIHDAASNGEEWLDETDDDDMDFEPTADESEDAEFFDPAEDPEADFHGLWTFRVVCRVSFR